MGRKVTAIELRLLTLALLADKARHGYEIIKALGERSKDFYVPSPGMVYPALAFLDKIGHAIIEVDDARKRYHITVPDANTSRRTVPPPTPCSPSSSMRANAWST